MRNPISKADLERLRARRAVRDLKLEAVAAGAHIFAHHGRDTATFYTSVKDPHRSDVLARASALRERIAEAGQGERLLVVVVTLAPPPEPMAAAVPINANPGAHHGQ